MPKTSIRVLALLVCVLVALMALAGCATRIAQEEPAAQPAAQAEAPKQEQSSGESAQPQQAADSAEGVTIEYTVMWSEGEPHSDWIREVIAEYEAVSNNKVNVTFVGRDVLTKIKSRILTGDPPDIVDQDGSEIAAALLSSDEILAESVNDLLDSPGLDGEAKVRDAFANEILELYNRGGNIYFLPYVYVTSGFFYDKTLFEQVGISAPKTWDEFIAAGEKFMADTGKPFLALDGTISFYNAYYYYWACQRILGSGKFFAAATDPTGAAWDDPGFLKAAEMVYELSEGGKNFFQEGYAGSAYPMGQSDWALGSQGSVLCGTWLPNEVINMVASDWKFGYFPFPAVSGGAGTLDQMEAYLIGWSIPKGAKNAEAAKDFLKFAINKKNAESMVATTLNMSSRLDMTPPEVLGEVQPYLQGANSYHLSYDGVQSNAPQWWADVFYGLDDQLIFGQITPQEFIAQIKEATINFYNK